MYNNLITKLEYNQEIKESKIKILPNQKSRNDINCYSEAWEWKKVRATTIY